jgi:hypothetical protein
VVAGWIVHGLINKMFSDKFQLEETPRDETPRDETTRDQTNRDQTPPDQTDRDQTPPDQTPRDQTPRDETLRDETIPDGTDRDETTPDETPGDGTPQDETPREETDRHLTSQLETEPKNKEASEDLRTDDIDGSDDENCEISVSEEREGNDDLGCFSSLSTGGSPKNVKDEKSNSQKKNDISVTTVIEREKEKPIQSSFDKLSTSANVIGELDLIEADTIPESSTAEGGIEDESDDHSSFAELEDLESSEDEFDSKPKNEDFDGDDNDSCVSSVVDMEDLEPTGDHFDAKPQQKDFGDDESSTSSSIVIMENLEETVEETVATDLQEEDNQTSVAVEMVHRTVKCMINDRFGILECHRHDDKLELPLLCYFEVDDLTTEGPVPVNELVRILSRKSPECVIKYSAQKTDCQTSSLVVPYICQNIEISGTIPEELKGITLMDKSSRKIVDEEKRQRFEMAMKLFSEGNVLTVEEILKDK